MKFKLVVVMRRVVLPWRKNIFTKRYFEPADQIALLSADDLVITEKVDGLTTEVEKDGFTFYTESLRYVHSIVYDRVPCPRNGAEPWLVCFDVAESGKFLSHDEVVIWADTAGFATPQVMHRGPITIEKLWEIAHFKSSFASDSLAEGVVLKSHKLGVWGKLVVDEFLSEMGEHWRDRPLVLNKML